MPATAAQEPDSQENWRARLADCFRRNRRSAIPISGVFHACPVYVGNGLGAAFYAVQEEVNSAAKADRSECPVSGCLVTQLANSCVFLYIDL